MFNVFQCLWPFFDTAHFVGFNAEGFAIEDQSEVLNVFLFEHAGIEDAQIPEFLRHIDESLLPWVHLEDRTLTFTVVRGHVVGDFHPDKEEEQHRK